MGRRRRGRPEGLGGWSAQFLCGRLPGPQQDRPAGGGFRRGDGLVCSGPGGRSAGQGAGQVLGVGPDQQVLDPVEPDRADPFLFEVDQAVEQPVESAEYLAAIVQLQVDPGPAAQARDHRRDLFPVCHRRELTPAPALRSARSPVKVARGSGHSTPARDDRAAGYGCGLVWEPRHDCFEDPGNDSHLHQFLTFRWDHGAVISIPVQQRILVIDDEPAVREALSRALELEGYGVLLASDGTEGINRLHKEIPDLVLLDVAMPVVDGLKACRQIRRLGNRTPILMLTARETVPDRVAGLEAGADDYLVKPFALAELNARIKALLRRGSGGEILQFDDLVLNPTSCEVWRGDRPLELTRTEFLMLELFLRHPRQVLTRDQINEGVWGYDFGPASNSVNVYVGYLRKKLEAGGEPRLLHTVRSVGYVLRQP